MNMNIRMTTTTMRILDMLLSNLSDGLSGAEIAKGTHLMSGTIYPILHRLEKAEWLTVETEQIDPSSVGRPRRKFYRLTGNAQRTAWEALNSRGYYGDKTVGKAGGYVPV